MTSVYTEEGGVPHRKNAFCARIEPGAVSGVWYGNRIIKVYLDINTEYTRIFIHILNITAKAT